MHIDIEKLELSDVLVALVNAGATNTMTIQGKLPLLTHRLGRVLIQEGIEAEALYFDSVLGRTLHVDLNDDVIDVSAYDKANGVGAALKALQAVGEVKIAHTHRFNHEMRSLKGSMEDRLSNRPDMLMTEASIRRRMTGEQYMESVAERFIPNKADMDAWMARWDAASPETRRLMIDDDSIKYAYPTKLEDYKLNVDIQLADCKIPAPEHAVYHPLHGSGDVIDGDMLNSAFFKDTGELHAALRMVGDRIVSVDVTANPSQIPDGHPMPTFENEYLARKQTLIKQRVAELGGHDGETYYVKTLGRLDTLPTVDRKNK